MAAGPGELRGRALWVLFGCLVCQLGLGLAYVTAPLLTDISADLGIPRAVFSSASAARLLVVSLASPFVGLLAARFGARAVLVPAALLVAPTFWWLGAVQSLWELVAANLLVGLLVAGFGDIAIGQVVATWVARGRGTALGVVYTGSNLAGATLVPLVAWLAAHGSWRDALAWVGIGGALVILPFAALVVREGPLRAPRAAPPIEPGSAGDLDLGRALRTRSFWILLFALAGFFFYMLAVLEHLVAALSDGGLPLPRAAGYLSAAIFLGLFSKVGMGILADRLPAGRAIQLDYGLLALSSLLLLRVPEPGFLELFVLCFGFAYAARDVVYPLAIIECFGARNLAPIYGALMVVLWPAGALGGVFAGFVFDTTGSYAPAFRAFAYLNLLVFASLFGLRRERV